jgi:hypothetical protein
MELEIFSLANWEFWPPAWDQNPTCSRGRNRLEMHLLLVKDVLVVEFYIGRI